jgi:hypothetical protein
MWAHIHYTAEFRSKRLDDRCRKQISNIRKDTLSNFLIFETNLAMAVVLEALASYVQSMLTDKAKEEVRMLLGVPTRWTR